mgnify:CR=1 FL=1
MSVYSGTTRLRVFGLHRQKTRHTSGPNSPDRAPRPRDTRKVSQCCRASQRAPRAAVPPRQSSAAAPPRWSSTLRAPAVARVPLPGAGSRANTSCTVPRLPPAPQRVSRGESIRGRLLEEQRPGETRRQKPTTQTNNETYKRSHTTSRKSETHS